jgi:hypothetical protein
MLAMMSPLSTMRMRAEPAEHDEDAEHDENAQPAEHA